MVDILSIGDVKALATARVTPAVSLFLPAHPSSREVRQDSIRLRKLAYEAVRRLVAQGVRAAIARAIIKPALSLAANTTFWHQRGSAVVLFLGPDFVRCYRVPEGLDEEVLVSGRFCVRPLLRLLTNDATFHVLAVSSARTRLFRATQLGLEEVTNLRLPRGVRAIAEWTDYQDTVFAHPLARRPTWRLRQGMGMVSNAGEDPDTVHRFELLEYLKRVAEVINEYFSGRHALVVLAALPEIQGHLRPRVRIQSLLAEALDVNPEALAEEVLRSRAYALVQPSLAAASEQELDRFNALQGDGSPKISTDAAAIVREACYARVDTLLLADGAQLWGRVADPGQLVEIHTSPGRNDDDLIDRAAIETLMHGGKVVLLPKERLPQQQPIAAIFRYG